MRLQSIAFSGYRSFAARSPAAPLRPLERLKLAPLTILIGKNNSGKSTAARLLHHVLLALGSSGVDPFPMDDGNRSYGARFRDVLHEGKFFNSLDIEVGMQSDTRDESTFQAKLIQLNDSGDDCPPVVEQSFLDGVNYSNGNSLRGLLPDVDAAIPWRDGARSLLSASCHLGPIRDVVKHSYPANTGGTQDQHPKNNAAIAQLLLSEHPFKNAVSNWMESSLDGWRVEPVQTLDDVKLFVRRSGRDSNLADAGQGIQQVLPVVALCCWRANHSDNSPFLDVIEQPELHLHDAAHAALGDLLLDAVKSNTGSLVVETHSESLVLRVRRRIAEGIIPPEMVEIVFIEDKGEGSRIRRIPLLKTGEVEWWPEGVFSEAFEEVKAIRKAQRSRGVN